MKNNYLIIFAVLFWAIVASARPANEGSGEYALIPLQGAINPIISQFVVDSIEQANRDNVSLIVIQLDTPGGLVNPMRDIIKAIMSSSVPVVVYTYPKGAQAASAGGFIMLSAHVAAMAPGTEIGAMHPVSPMLDYMRRDQKGDPSGVMEKKVLNDTVAYARSLAQKRDRNEEWAVKAVKEAISITYQEALEQNVIDYVAESLPDLLRQIDGKTISLHGEDVTLSTASLREKAFTMDTKTSFLNHLANPQLVMILFILAIAGIGMEFKNPGMIVPGAIGVLSLILFLIASRILPINFVGVLLIIMGVVLFILELQITSFGLLTLGGVASFIIGSLILFDSPLPGGGVSWPTILSMLVVLLLFVFVILRAILKAHQNRVSTGIEGLVGARGVALKDFQQKGTVRVHGEIWSAKSDTPLAKDDEIEVKSVNGMLLTVTKLDDNAS